MRLPAPCFVVFLLGAPAFGQATPQANITIARPVVSQSEDGSPLDADSLVPGETAYFSFVVEGIKAGPSEKIQLVGHVQAFDPQGRAISVVDEQTIATTLSQEDKNWKPKIRSQFLVPPIAPTGVYRIRYEVTDSVTRKTAKGESTFPVRGRMVDPANELVIRNFGFFRTQDETAPLRTPAYRAGDLLWVKLDITGYKYGEQNAVDVAYDVEVFGPNGKSLFAQQDAAVERSQAFYPQPWVPVEFNLSLQTTMTPGPYTIVITAHDGIGKQTVSARGEFRVD